MNKMIIIVGYLYVVFLLFFISQISCFVAPNPNESSTLTSNTTHAHSKPEKTLKSIHRKENESNHTSKAIAKNGKFGIFLLGDSTSGLIYTESLRHLFACTTTDPYIHKNTELIPYPTKIGNLYRVPGLLCNHPFIERIGFQGNWGVSYQDEDYLNFWKSHKIENDTNNSPKNIFLAIEEFRQRHNHEITNNSSHKNTLFFFLSNFWDSAKRVDHQETELLDLWVEKMRANYLRLVKDMLDRLHRPEEELVLIIPHPPAANWAHLVPLLNLIILEASMTYHLRVFRQDIIFLRHIRESKEIPNHLLDFVHQKHSLSKEFGVEMEKLIYHIIKERDQSIR